MSRMVVVLVAVAMVAGVVASMAPASGQAEKQTRDDLAGTLARREVQRAPLAMPGHEMVQVETLIPAGVESGWHVHPGEEVGYILAGQGRDAGPGTCHRDPGPRRGISDPPADPA
jgi:hypothetical protein